MNLSSASSTSVLSARAVPVSATLPTAGKRLTATAEIGGTVSVSYPTADIAYAVEIVSDAALDAVELDLLSGVGTITTGSPEVTGAAADFSGVTLPTASTIHTLRITAAADNTGNVSAGVTVAGDLFTASINPGQTIHLIYPADGLSLVADDGLVITFEDGTDTLTIEVIAATA